jgi:hypothetical protein
MLASPLAGFQSWNARTSENSIGKAPNTPNSTKNGLRKA